MEAIVLIHAFLLVYAVYGLVKWAFPDRHEEEDWTCRTRRR